MTLDDLHASARDFLDRVERLGREDPEQALGLLRRRVRLYLPAVRWGRGLHHRLREVVHGLSGSHPNRVSVVDMTEVADLEAVARARGELSVEAVAVVDGATSADSDVVSEVEAETLLLGRSETVLVVLADGRSFCARSTFLDHAQRMIEAECPSAQLGRALERLATEQGLGVARL
jgi:hypothetical protein